MIYKPFDMEAILGEVDADDDWRVKPEYEGVYNAVSDYVNGYMDDMTFDDSDTEIKVKRAFLAGYFYAKGFYGRDETE